jgi:cytochrome c oxidase subunit IV
MSDLKPTVHEHDDHKVPPISSTLTTFVVLAVLAAVALAVGFSNLGPMKVFASLAVTAVQAVVLSLFFMDLRQADRLTWLCAGAAVFWVLIMFVFTITDYVTRHMSAY